MELEKLKPNDVRALLKRRQYEDQLLNSRTGIVLLLNGLTGVAANLSLPSQARLVIAVAVIAIDFFWLLCALDTQRYIKRLTDDIKKSGMAPLDEQIRLNLFQNRRRIGPTTFMSIVAPTLLLAVWVIASVLVALCCPQ
jgi:hypothetical protein